MPNHVASSVIIIGDKKEIDKLKNTVKGDEGRDNFFDFKKIIPMPSNIYTGDLGQKEKEKYGKNNWYDWSIENWGTKWNCYSQSEPIEQEPSNAVNFIADKDIKIIKFFFSTAWSPVYQILEKIAEMYPEVLMKYSYHDEGHNFGGHTYYANGREIGIKEFNNESSYRKLYKEINSDVLPDLGKLRKEFNKYL